MPKVLPAIYSYEDMKAKWLQDNPDNPYTRRSDLETGRYALDKWLIRVDDEGKTLAVIGWKEHPKHTVTGGLLATARGREIGNNTAALVAARKPQMPQNNPLVTSFKHRDGDNSRWIAGGKRAGWAFPDDTELFEQYSSLLPEDVKNDWLQAYPETFGTKPINPESLSKEMYDGVEGFMMAKNERYIRELGESGYNIIDTTNNKRLNTIGLSKSQAKNMLQLLKEGKSVWEYTKPRHSRWKSQLKKSASNWADILKIDPTTGGYEPLPFADIQNQHTSTPFMGKVVDGVGIIFNAHYHYKYTKRKRVRLTLMTDSLARKFIAFAAGEGQWCYINDDAKDFSYVMFDRLMNPNDKIKRTNPVKKVKSLGLDPATRLPITQAVVLHHINDGHDAQLSDKKVDLFYTGIKPGHLTKISVTRNKPNNRPEDENIPDKYTKEEAKKVLEDLQINTYLPKGFQKKLFRDKLNNTKSQEEIDKEMERMTEYFSM
jgi:hypothetical protein